MKTPGVPRSVCIDIETKSTDKNAFILSIGAVAFDDFGFKKTFEACNPSVWYGQVPWNDPQQIDRHVSDSTLEWWDTQRKPLQILRHPNSQEAQFVYAGLREMLAGFLQFVKEERHGGKVMAWGTDFDCAIIDQALSFTGLMKDKSWRYGDHLCCRAFFEACHRAGIDKVGTRKRESKPELIAHHAADDAIGLANKFIQYNHCLWKIGQPAAQQQLRFLS